MSEKEKKAEKESIKTVWQYEKWVSIFGKWTWILVLIIALLYFLATIYTISSYTYLFIGAKLAWESNNSSSTYYYVYEFQPVWFWDIISPIILMYFAHNTLRSRFSKPCKEKDWNRLLDDVWIVGETRIPRMLIWFVITEIFGLGIAGMPIFIIAILLLYKGPQKYEWKK